MQVNLPLPTAVPNTTFDAEPELKALFLKAQEGCNISYNSFLKKMAVCMRGYFRKRLSSHPSEVEDLVQEVLLAIHNQRHTYQQHYPITAWAHGIARYKAIDFYRRQGRAEHVDIEDVQEFLIWEDNEAHHTQRDVSSLLEALPPRQREAIVHVKLEGLSIAEASRQTGQSESLVKVDIHRGLKKLADLMKSKAS